MSDDLIVKEVHEFLGKHQYLVKMIPTEVGCVIKIPEQRWQGRATCPVCVYMNYNLTTDQVEISIMEDGVTQHTTELPCPAYAMPPLCAYYAMVLCHSINYTPHLMLFRNKDDDHTTDEDKFLTTLAEDAAFLEAEDWIKSRILINLCIMSILKGWSDDITQQAKDQGVEDGYILIKNIVGAINGQEENKDFMAG